MRVDTWLTDVVTVSSVTGKSGYGDPVFGAQRQVKCRLQVARTTVTRPDGTESDAGHILRTTTPIKLDDHIWLPGSNTADMDAAKTPVNVEASHDKSGSTTIYRVTL